MIFKQMYCRETCTFTYIIADASTREAVIIDPVYELVDRDLGLVDELQLKVLYCLDTHIHADHVTAGWLIRERTGCQYGVGKKNGAENVDIPLVDGQELHFGSHVLRTIETPGHSSGCMTYAVANMLFTGDCLFVRGCGRSDFQSGSASQLYHSIKEILFSFPDNTLVYPAHDYNGRLFTSIGEEKAFNPRIGGKANEDDFVGYMDNLNLAHPARIKEAVPLNLKGGRPSGQTQPPSWGPVTIDFAGIPQVEAKWVSENLSDLQLIDVRRREEIEESGTLSGAIHIPLEALGSSVNQIDTQKPTVVICRSGRRSGHAVTLLKDNGLHQVANLKNGILNWEEMALPFVSYDWKKTS